MSVKASLRSYGKFLKILWERKCGVVISMFYRAFSGLIITALSVYMPKFLIKSITDQNEIAFFVGTAFFCGVSAVVAFSESFLFITQENTLSQLTFLLQEKVQYISMTMPFEKTENASVLNKTHIVLNSISSSVGAIYKSSPMFISSAVLLAVFTVTLCRLGPLVVILTLVNIPINIWLAARAKTFRFGLQSEIADAERHKNYVFNISSDYAYAKEIRLNRADGILKGFFGYYKKTYLDLCGRMQKKDAFAALPDLLITFLREAAAYVALAFLAVESNMPADELVLYISTISAIKGVIFTITSSSGDLAFGLMNFGTYTDYVESAEWKRQVRDSEDSGGYQPVLRLRDIRFHYPNTENILDGFSFTFETGKHYAVVGENGSGKSTLIKLISGLYSSYEGVISVGEKDIRSIGTGRVATVFQDSKIFSGTVRENIVCGNAFSRERYDEVLRVLDLDRLLSGMPKGDETILTKIIDDEGIELSGGQYQKIALARALYQGGDILLLDEPTAALDAIAEYEMYSKFHEISKNKTTVFVSHRLNSTRFCDYILFMEKGKIVEQGTHSELLAKKGKYAEMYNLQAQYYNRGGAKG